MTSGQRLVLFDETHLWPPEEEVTILKTSAVGKTEDLPQIIPGVTMVLEVADRGPVVARGQLLVLEAGEEISRQCGIPTPVLLRPMP